MTSESASSDSPPIPLIPDWAKQHLLDDMVQYARSHSIGMYRQAFVASERGYDLFVEVHLQAHNYVRMWCACAKPLDPKYKCNWHSDHPFVGLSDSRVNDSRTLFTIMVPLNKATEACLDELLSDTTFTGSTDPGWYKRRLLECIELLW
jgi:hypothetical protein